MSIGNNEVELNQLECDQNALRVEVDPSENHTPLQAAWLLGRLVNELRYRFQESWILYGDDEPERTSRTWVDLVALSELAINSEEANGPIRAPVDRARSDWENSFRSESHSEEVVYANDAVRLYRSEDHALPGGSSNEIDYLAHISWNVTAIMDQLELGLTSSMNGPAKIAFQMGRLADQLIHPPLNNRVICFDSSTFPVPMSWAAAEPGGCEETRARMRGLRFPRQFRRPWPDQEWIRQATRLLANFSRATNQEINPSAEWNSGTEISRFLDDLYACVFMVEPDWTELPHDSEDHVFFTRRGQRAARTLKLFLEIDSRRVCASQSEISERLSPVQFRLLLFFLHYHGRPRPIDCICSAWELISPGRTTPVEAATVRTQISKLNQKLKNMKVEVRSTGGYSLYRVSK